MKLARSDVNSMLGCILQRGKILSVRYLAILANFRLEAKCRFGLRIKFKISRPDSLENRNKFERKKTKINK